MKLNGKTVRSKPKVVRNPLFMDEKYTGEEPTWNTERAKEYDQATFDRHLRRSFYYYNYYYSQKDTKKYMVEWMKSNTEFTAEEVKAFERSPDKACEMTAHSLIMAHRAGMPFRDNHLAYIDQAIERAIRQAVPEVAEVKPQEVKAYVPTIQDRLNEKTAETIGELEGHYDQVVQDPKYQFKPYDYLVANNVPQSQLSKYEQVYQRRFDELKAAYEKEDKQLTEGYSHYRVSDYKRIMAFLHQLLNDILAYRNVKKATKKVRAPRAVSKEKQVAKLRYAKEDKALKLVSVNPADILGAQELWVYNTKTRKLGRYVADSLQGPLGVKGTTITGYDEARSVAKTLRKPEDKLKEFAKSGKIQLRKFLDEIKATETRLNGRISADMLLLRVQ
jgi:uncharacterized protein (UPF0147 family)